MYKKKIFFIFLFFLGFSIFYVLNSCLSCEYIEGFGKIEGISSVDNFSQYEDHLSVEITLDNGGFLDIGVADHFAVVV